MFDKSMFDEFYKFEYAEDFSVKEEVKKAYYEFIKKFCTLTSPTWREYLKLLDISKDGKYGEHLTPSDEVFTYWYLYYFYDEAVRNVEYMKEKDIELKDFPKKKPKDKGVKHMSSQYITEHAKLYSKLEEHRRNKDAYKFWQNIFLVS